MVGTGPAEQRREQRRKRESIGLRRRDERCEWRRRRESEVRGTRPVRLRSLTAMP